MIAKRIRNPSVSASKSLRIQKLSDYILNINGIDGQSKCIYSNWRGFLCTSIKSRQVEMIALATACVRSRDPIRHYVISFKEFERPTFAQIEQAIDIILHELGLTEHQVIFGLHDDTDNFHCHIAVNIVNPITEKVVKPGGGFDIEALHRSIARIEHGQGWVREIHGRYSVQNDGSFSPRPTNVAKKLRPTQSNVDAECRTGVMSAERIGIEEAGPILRTAKTWQELHYRLSQKGLRYEKVGSGAVVFVGTTAVKASSCDRNGGISKLEKKLGVWEPSAMLPSAPARLKPVPLIPSSEWRQYIELRSAFFEQKHKARERLKALQAKERTDLYRTFVAERKVTARKSDVGAGILRMAFLSVLASRHAIQKIELRERQAGQRKALAIQYPAWPDFESWLEQQDLYEDAMSWRYRLNPQAAPACIYGPRESPFIKNDLRDYSPKIEGNVVSYRYQPGGHVAFIDKGRSIVLNDSTNANAILAALQLASQKWGSFSVSGDSEYKSICAQLASENGFKILNPELQNDIQQKRSTTYKPTSPQCLN